MAEEKSRDLFGNGLLRSRSEVTDLKRRRLSSYKYLHYELGRRLTCSTCGKDATLTEGNYLVCPGHSGLVDPCDLHEGGEKAEGLSIQVMGQDIKGEWVEISDLPPHPSGFQREWIDDFFQKHIDECAGRKILNARYGHANDYPRGFGLLLKREHADQD
jgi:hypothetical protein